MVVVLIDGKQSSLTDLDSYSSNSKYIPSLNMNYRKNKVNFSLQAESMFLNKLPNNEFTKPYYEAEVTGYMNFAPKNIPQGIQHASSSIDMRITRKIFKGKGELSFSASDIFNTFGIYQEITGDGFTAICENYYETQVFRLGLKYRF